MNREQRRAAERAVKAAPPPPPTKVPKRPSEEPRHANIDVLLDTKNRTIDRLQVSLEVREREVEEWKAYALYLEEQYGVTNDAEAESDDATQDGEPLPGNVTELPTAVVAEAGN